MTQFHTPPNSKVQTSHSLIVEVNGQVIGAVQKMSFSLSMDATPVYEFGNITGPFGKLFGMPFEHVPGNSKGFSFSIDRMDLFEEPFERVFGPGTTPLSVLANNTGRADAGEGAFDIVETITRPDGQKNKVTYKGCWLTQIGRTKSVSDNRITMMSAQGVFTDRLFTVES